MVCPSRAAALVMQMMHTDFNEHLLNMEQITADFLSRLANVEVVKCGQYLACCPGHTDRRPSLLITETDDRLLIYCRAGCSTSDILAAVGLDYHDLFTDTCKTKQTPRRQAHCLVSRFPDFPWNPCHPPNRRWNWRKQCAALECVIQAIREHHEAILKSTCGLDIDPLSDSELDEVMGFLGKAYDWLTRCERLEETLFLVQQTLRAEEGYHRDIKRRKKMMA